MAVTKKIFTAAFMVAISLLLLFSSPSYAMEGEEEYEFTFEALLELGIPPGDMSFTMKDLETGEERRFTVKEEDIYHIVNFTLPEGDWLVTDYSMEGTGAYTYNPATTTMDESYEPVLKLSGDTKAPGVTIAVSSPDTNDQYVTEAVFLEAGYTLGEVDFTLFKVDSVQGDITLICVREDGAAFGVKLEDPNSKETYVKQLPVGDYTLDSVICTDTVGRVFETGQSFTVSIGPAASVSVSCTTPNGTAYGKIFVTIYDTEGNVSSQGARFIFKGVDGTATEGIETRSYVNPEDAFIIHDYGTYVLESATAMQDYVLLDELGCDTFCVTVASPSYSYRSTVYVNLYEQVDGTFTADAAAEMQHIDFSTSIVDSKGGEAYDPQFCYGEEAVAAFLASSGIGPSAGSFEGQEGIVQETGGSGVADSVDGTETTGAMETMDSVVMPTEAGTEAAMETAGSGEGGAEGSFSSQHLQALALAGVVIICLSYIIVTLWKLMKKNRE